MDPNREGFRPEGQDSLEEKRSMRPPLVEDEPGFEPLGQEPVEDNKLPILPAQHLPEDGMDGQNHIEPKDAKACQNLPEDREDIG